jgi:glycosyltransferase involved in cell wall biosynthesis
MLRILRPSFSSRSAHDVLSEVTADNFRKAGVPCEARDLWPEYFAKHMLNTGIPGFRFAFRKLPAVWGAADSFRSIKAEDTVFVSGTSLPDDKRCYWERQIKAQGAKYIFNLIDDWMSISFQKDQALSRLELADAIVVPTQALADRVQEFSPAGLVLVLEEPVDVNRVYPISFDPSAGKLPVVVWSGNPHNLQEIPPFFPVFERVYRETPFCLRIISGLRPPPWEPPVPMEWLPYSFEHEVHALAGAHVGIVPLSDSLYSRCKGVYKIKIYLAAGLGIIASDVGYCRQLIRSGTNGFLALNHDDWEDRLIRVLRDPELTQNMKTESRKDAVEKYSHGVVIKDWIKQLKQVSLID